MESSRLHADRALLVVVDLQEKLLPALPGRDRVVRNAILLLRVVRALGVPVLATTQYSKGLGPIVEAVAAEVPDFDPIDKVSFGCFGDTGFVERLGLHASRRQLLLCGIESHICVAQTALEALESGRSVHVVSDAVGARTEENHRIGLDRMEAAGAVLSSTEMAAYELLGRSDVPAFKSLLPLLKG
jgi:nicotinamidase-related amidase